MVVELSDVALCVSPREESDWEEGPALRRLQAAKQAQLAAAELAKLGSRVAATGRGATTQQQADYAAATAAGTAANTTAASAAGPAVGSSWGWAIVDYVASFLLNRLQVTIKNVHVYFEVGMQQSHVSCSHNENTHNSSPAVCCLVLAIQWLHMDCGVIAGLSTPP